MSRYKKGDIVVCVTDKMYGVSYSEQPISIQVGELYQIVNLIEIPGKKLVSVSKVKTGEYVSIFDDKHFIPLDIWREFQLGRILE